MPKRTPIRMIPDPSRELLQGQLRRQGAVLDEEGIRALNAR